ncbi:helix-turn-helix transcriptional regulator [Streptomyces sp. NPDC051940]|uniref:helix-turn-helix transcriptional regulator n=1 Tax=Streptomyces sp. NPDC051940 TaxID=3155675 RepID=UPI0034373359
MAVPQRPHSHPGTEVCPEGWLLYVRALTEGAVSRETAEPVSCLRSSGLLQPDAVDPGLARPMPPVVGLVTLLTREGRARRERMSRLQAQLQDLADSGPREPDGFPMGRIVGSGPINARLDAAAAECTREMLTMQPTAKGASPAALERAFSRDTELLERGVSMRTLYVHAVRFNPSVMAYQERIRGYAVQVRTMPAVIERMIVVDDAVAFIPATTDRSEALEIRYPPFIQVLRACFEVLWRLGTPLWEPVEYGARGEQVSPVQRYIARMLAGGLADAAIADRLGVNVRTVRGHIARLSRALGSANRAQLGFLIAQSRILDEDLPHGLHAFVENA